MSQAIVTESKLTAIGDAIRQQLGTSTPYTLDEMATAIASISGGGGGGGDDNKLEVMVFDYDGTILDQVKLDNGDTYTLPTPPIHAGLTFVDWSCTETITSNTITISDCDVMIGANYTTSSGLSEFDIELTPSDVLTIRFYAYSGDVVYWGDGTNDTASSNGYIVHTYSSSGNYTISYSGTTIYAYGMSSAYYNNSTIISGYANNSASDPDFVKAIRLSNNVTSISSTYAFASIKFCRQLILSKNVTTIPSYMFQQSSYCLQCLIIPNGVTRIEKETFRECKSLTEVSIPNSVTVIDNSACKGKID